MNYKSKRFAYVVLLFTGVFSEKWSKLGVFYSRMAKFVLPIIIREKPGIIGRVSSYDGKDGSNPWGLEPTTIKEDFSNVTIVMLLKPL